uniref:Uncharacterized protein n=1 Tax=Helianthus annuus TaxID=4232 RepID=A0A251SXW9_HELAN
MSSRHEPVNFTQLYTESGISTSDLRAAIDNPTAGLLMMPFRLLHFKFTKNLKFHFFLLHET